MTASPHESLARTLARVHAFAQARGLAVHIVGGLLRDQHLGRPAAANVDLAVPRGALEHAAALAAELRAAFVPLDPDAGTARVVVGGADERLELDVSDYRGPTLEEDLRRRDFSMNAMAVALGDWLRDPARPGPVMDPTGGREAMARRELVPCSPQALAEDPLRLLRALRFQAQLGFTLHPSLPDLMRRAAEGLAAVSGERVRDELLAICATDAAAPALAALDGLGVLDVLVPELIPGRGMDQGGYHHLDVLGHQVEAVRQADRILADFAEFAEPLRGPLAAYCAETLIERRPRKSLIKLGCLLHDVGKPVNRQVHEDGEIWFIGHEHSGADIARRVVERLRLANREADLVCQLVRHHLRPGFLSREPALTPRAIYRFYKDLGEHGPACLLTWWSDRMATRGPRSRLDQLDQQRQVVETLLTPYFFKPEEVIRPPRLVDGHDLMQRFRLPPGPRIGELLGLVEEAQAEGRVRTPEDAFALVQARLAQAPPA
jgi:putative nucleotidyltransferase with HDIG domain